MLERIALRLESGGWRFLPYGRLRRRMLHSSFWVHGAAELDFAAVAASVFGCGGGAAGDDPSRLAAMRRRAEGVHLDFLYPSKTLAFLRTMSAAGGPRRDEKLVLAVGMVPGMRSRRMYSSVAATPAEPTTVPPEALVSGLSPRPPYKMEVDDVYVQLGLPRLHSPDRPPGGLLYSDLNAFINFVAVSKRKDLSDEAWYHYCISSFRKDAPGEHSRARRRFILRYLTETPTITNRKRVLSVLMSMKPTSITQQNYKLMLDNLIALGQPELMFPFIRNYMETTSEAHIHACCWQDLLAYFIDLEYWESAHDVYRLVKKRDRWNQGERGTWRKYYQDSQLASRIPGFHGKLFAYVRDLSEESSITQWWLGEDLLKALLKSYTAPGTMWDSRWEEVLALIREKGWYSLTQRQYERILWHLAARGKHSMVAELYPEFRQRVINPEVAEGLLNAVLLSYRHLNDFDGMQRVFNDFFEIAKNKRPDEKAYWLFMQKMADMGEANLVRELLDEKIKRFPITVRDFCYMMQAHAKRGELKQTIEWFDAIPAHGFRHTLVSYTILMNLYAKLSDIDSTLDLFQDLLNEGLKPDEYVYRCLMEMSATRGDTDVTEIYFRAAQERGYKNGFLFEELATAYVEADQVDEAVAILGRAGNELGQEDTHIWNTVLSGYAARGDSVNLLSLYNQMLRQKVPFNEHTYGLLMHSFCLSDRILAAENVLKIMKEQGFRVNQVHYAILMVAHTRNLNLAGVLRTFNHMLAQGISPTFMTVGVMIQAYAFTDYKIYREEGVLGTHSAEAEKLLDDICSRKDLFDPTSPDVAKSSVPPWLFTPLMSIYAKEGMWQRSLELFDRFLSRATTSMPNVQMYIALMQAYSFAGNGPAVVSTYQSAKAYVMYHYRRAIPTAQDQFVDTHSILPQYRYFMARPFSILIRVLAREGNVDAIIAETNSLDAAGFVPDNVNWNDIVRAIAIAGDLLVAGRVAEQKLMTHVHRIMDYYAYSVDELRRGPLVHAMPPVYPFIRTVETLATELKVLDDARKAGDEDAAALMKLFWRNCKQTWNVCNRISDLDQRVQKELAYRQATGQPVEGRELMVKNREEAHQAALEEAAAEARARERKRGAGGWAEMENAGAAAGTGPAVGEGEQQQQVEEEEEEGSADWVPAEARTAPAKTVADRMADLERFGRQKETFWVDKAVAGDKTTRARSPVASAAAAAAELEAAVAAAGMQAPAVVDPSQEPLAEQAPPEQFVPVETRPAETEAEEPLEQSAPAEQPGPAEPSVLEQPETVAPLQPAGDGTAQETVVEPAPTEQPVPGEVVTEQLSIEQPAADAPPPTMAAMQPQELRKATPTEKKKKGSRPKKSSKSGKK